MRKQAEKLPENDPYWKTLESIESMKESDGMKHVLAVWVLDLALSEKKIPDRLLSRRKTSQFQNAVTQAMKDDLERFRVSTLVAVICASLCCMFLRNVMLGSYLINFSVDALVAAAAAAGMFINLGVSFRTIRIYGKTRDFLLTDVSALILWYLLFLLWPQFDTSLVIFLLAYLFERRKFRRMLDAFADTNGFEKVSSSK